MSKQLKKKKKDSTLHISYYRELGKNKHPLDLES